MNKLVIPDGYEAISTNERFMLVCSKKKKMIRVRKRNNSVQLEQLKMQSRAHDTLCKIV